MNWNTYNENKKGVSSEDRADAKKYKESLVKSTIVSIQNKFQDVLGQYLIGELPMSIVEETLSNKEMELIGDHIDSLHYLNEMDELLFGLASEALIKSKF